MQADEFEKKIQKKLEGFQLVPDNEMWTRVAVKLEKERNKRRVLIYWLLVGFVFLAGTSAYWFINNENSRKFVKSEVNSNFSKGENYKLKQNTATLSGGLNGIKKIKTAKTITYLKGKLKHAPTSQLENKPVLKIAFAKALKNTSNVTTKNNISNKVNEENREVKFLPPHRFYNPALTTKAKVDTGLMNNNVNEKTQFEKETSLKTTVKETSKTQKEKIKNWRFGFTIYTGISDNLSGLSSTDKSYAQNYYPGSSANSGNYNYDAKVSNNFNSGMSFGFGIFLQKTLTKKLSLSAGVDYHLYTSKSTVGSKVDQQRSFYDSALDKSTSVNTYYAADNYAKYVNKYHFIELPINLGYQINKNKAKPLIFSAGISPGFLVSTNALYANTSSNVYYSDRQKFHHFQLASQIGFSFPIISRSNYQLSAGPSVQYSFTNASKSITSTSQHLFFTGIKANIIFK